MATLARIRALPLLLAVGSFALVVVFYYLFAASAVGQRLEDEALKAASIASPLRWDFLGSAVGNTLEIFAGLAAVLVVVLTLARRRFLELFLLVAAGGGAMLTTQVLKHDFFHRPDTGLQWTGPNSMPSGHTTAGIVCAIAVVLACPRAWRGILAWVMAGVGAYVGYGTLAHGWHRPADVVTAFAVAVGWYSLAIALGAGATKPGAQRNRVTTVSVIVLGIAGSVAVIGSLIAIWRWQLGMTQQVDLILGAAGAIFGSAAVLMSLLCLAANRSIGPHRIDKETVSSDGTILAPADRR